MKIFKTTYLAACVFSVLVSCKVTKEYKKPSIASAKTFRGIDHADTTSIASIKWKDFYTDSLLQLMIREGIDHNLDLQKAYSITMEARANYVQSKAAFFPALNADASYTWNNQATGTNSNFTQRSKYFQAELTASWEADIWGKLNSAKKSQLAALLQADANARAVQTDLVANIATNYYKLMALDEDLTITEQSVKNWQLTVDVMRKLKAADILTGAAVVQSEAAKYAVLVTIPDLKQNIWETENVLNLLLGRDPGPIIRNKIAKQSQIAVVSTGLPAALLSNRPDLQAAENALRSNFELTNVARTYFYPALTISGSGGYLSTRSFFNTGSIFGNLIGGLTQPILNKGINRARLKIAKEQQRQALLTFKNTFLTAGEEVSNAMMSYRTAGEKAVERQGQLENLKKSVNYTLQLVKFGSANYTEVLTAQQNLLNAQLGEVNDKLQQLSAVVYLYRALGGGWK